MKRVDSSFVWLLGMAPKSSGEEMAVSAGGRMIHDAGSDLEVSLSMFCGRNEDWPIWSARFGAYPELAVGR